MKQRVAAVAILFAQLLCAPLRADAPEIGGPQNTYEKEVQSVVRNKRYYKSGNLELGISGGLLPYDSLYGQAAVGGRLTWHLSDHYGWEVLDLQLVMGGVTSYITSLVSDTTKNIVNLQALRMKTAIGSGFVMSPFYGKIRFFGAQVVYLDIYVTLGLGLINTETTQYTHAAGSYTSTVLNSGWDPALNYGAGFKFFLSDSFTLFFDLRNYMTHSQMYGRRSFSSNFTVTGGLSIFLPGMG